MAGPPQRLMVSPHVVAKKIMHAVKTRPRNLNAVPWQTTMVALSELFPALTDAVLAAFPQIVGSERLAVVENAPPQEAPNGGVTLSLSKGEPVEAPQLCHPEPVEGSSLDKALEPLARRMERVKLHREFIEQLLVPGATLELGEVAMRWAGMPNKNERAAVAEVFEALTTSHYLQKTGDETWTVLRSSTDS